MPIVIIQGTNAVELAAKVAAVLDTDVQPIGEIFIVGNADIGRILCQAMGEADSTITDYEVIYSDNLSGLGAKLDTALAVADTSLLGGIKIVGDNVNFRQFIQAVVVGGQATGGGGGAALPAAGTAQELVAGTETAVRLWSPKLIHDEVARQVAAIP